MEKVSKNAYAERKEKVVSIRIDHFSLNEKTKSALLGAEKIIVQNLESEIADFNIAWLDRSKYFSDLKEIRVSGKGNFYSSEDGKILFHKSGNGIITLVYYIVNQDYVEIPEGVEVIGDKAFLDSDVRSVKFPDSLSEIGHRSFAYCRKLESVNFGKNIQKIGSCAFSSCRNLKSIKISACEPGNEIWIKDHAFSFCEELQVAELGEGISKIEDYAFWGCFNLKEITLPKSLHSVGANSLEYADIVRIRSPVDGLAEACVFCVNYFFKPHCESQFLRIEFGNISIVVPKRTKNLLPKLDDVLNLVFLLEPKDKKKVFDLSGFAADPYGQRQVLLEAFRLNPDETAGKRVKKFWRELLDDQSEEGDEGKFLDLLQLFRKGGLQTQELLKESIRIAGENGWPRVTAYSLGELNEACAVECSFEL